MHIKHKTGFTLFEIIVVVIVIGVLAGMALPRFLGTAERVRAREGQQLLLALFSAQKHYALEHQGNYADSLADLDIGTRHSANFQDVVDADINTANPIARVRRQGGSYNLEIDGSGSISCTPSGSGCSKAGY